MQYLSFIFNEKFSWHLTNVLRENKIFYKRVRIRHRVIGTGFPKLSIIKLVRNSRLSSSTIFFARTIDKRDFFFLKNKKENMSVYNFYFQNRKNIKLKPKQ